MSRYTSAYHDAIRAVFRLSSAKVKSAVQGASDAATAEDDVEAAVAEDDDGDDVADDDQNDGDATADRNRRRQLDDQDYDGEDEEKEEAGVESADSGKLSPVVLRTSWYTRAALRSQLFVSWSNVLKVLCGMFRLESPENCCLISDVPLPG